MHHQIHMLQAGSFPMTSFLSLGFPLTSSPFLTPPALDFLHSTPAWNFREMSPQKRNKKKKKRKERWEKGHTAESRSTGG